MKSDESVIKVYSPIAKAWASFKSPLKPIKDELIFYEKCIAKATHKKNAKVLILGVTPELREICSKYRLDVTLVDICKEMVDAMEEVIKHKNPKEKVVIANWLDMKFDTKFDLVIGDIVINLFDLKNWGLFLTKIKSILKEDGFFLTRLVLKIPSIKKMTIENMIKKYRKGVGLGKLDRTGVFLNDKEVCRPKTCKVDLEIFNKKLKKLLDKKIITPAEYEELKLPVSSIPLIVPTKDYFEKLLKRKFKVISSYNGKEFVFLKYFPIYFLRTL